MYRHVVCTLYWCAIDRSRKAISPSAWYCPSANLLLVEQQSLRSMLDVKAPVADALKVGEEVTIIGGTYCGRDGSFVRSTPKMHYVKLSPDKVVRVYHGNVKRRSLVAAHSVQEVKEVVGPVTVGDKDLRSSAKQLTLVKAVNLMLDIKVEMLKEGDEVIIIGGTHRGREGTLVGSTPKMYYVRVGPAEEVRVQQGNVTSCALLEKLVKALALK